MEHKTTLHFSGLRATKELKIPFIESDPCSGLEKSHLNQAINKWGEEGGEGGGTTERPTSRTLQDNSEERHYYQKHLS